jgi:hypothetical protein
MGDVETALTMLQRLASDPDESIGTRAFAECALVQERNRSGAA